jgi:hypothetical protein
MKPIWNVLIGTLISAHGLANCLVDKPEDRGNRKDCLAKAHFLLPQAETPPVSSADFHDQLTQPLSKNKLILNGDTVYCRYVHQEQNGNSAKFRCLMTDKNDVLYDSKGKLIEEAKGIEFDGDDFILTDAQGKKLVKDKKKDDGSDKFRKAMTLKVRYFQEGSTRNIENYTSSAASRIFWALGIPAHVNYMTKQVICKGCGSDPVKQKAPVMEGDHLQVTPFQDASVEVKFDAKRMYNPRQDAWDWKDVENLKSHSSQEVALEMDVLALASNFVGVTSGGSAQNAMVCRDKDEEFLASGGECQKVTAMIHDLGAAFGKREAKTGGDLPRGNVGEYETYQIFKDKCHFTYSKASSLPFIGGKLPQEISEAARIEFLRRAEVALTEQNLKTIFHASQMGHLMNSKADEATAGLTEDRWVKAVRAKIDEVRAASCAD